MTPRPRVSRRSRVSTSTPALARAVTAALAVSSAGVLACSDPVDTPLEKIDVGALAALIVSPAGPGAPPGPPGVSGPGAMTYVSLPPGSLPDGRSVRIRNLTTDANTDAVAFLEGGFDPIPVVAAVGEELQILLTLVNGSTGSLRLRVSGSTPPTIVRTSPPGGRTDVALSSRPSIVFSEPIDPRRLTSESVQLLKAGTPIQVSIHVTPDQPWVVELVPLDPLAPGETYDLVVSQDVWDLEGQSLEAPFAVQFETLTPPAGAGLVKLSSVATGGAFDLDGFSVQLDDGASQVTDFNELLVRDGVQEGPHVLRIRGLAENCSVAGGADQDIVVSVGSATTVELAIACVAPPELASFRIAFARAPQAIPDHVGSQIIAMRADGSERVELTTGEFYDYGPDVSPDGLRIAFMRDDPADGAWWDSDLYVMGSDGAAPTPVVRHAFDADWSPDGRRIAFTSSLDGGLWGGRIGVVDVDAGAVSIVGDFHEAAGPRWSPDGERLAFTLEEWPPSNGGTQYWWQSALAIWTVRPDGTDAQLVRRGDPWGPLGSIWSPDGEQLAFVEAEGVYPALTSRIRTVSLDGTATRTLLESDEDLHVHDWSGDESSMLYTKGGDVFLLRVADGSVTRLTAGGANNQSPTFWP